MSTRAFKMFVVASVVAVVSACSSPVKLDESSNVPVEDRSGQNTGANPNGVARVDTTQQGLDPLNDPKGVLAQRSVYFDFDSYVVKDQYRPIVENHSRFLNNNRNRKVVIEGNTDDVGSSEYNLALGQRRSEAVRRMMVLLGVRDDQVEAISFGKEKLKSTGTDEASRAENRRADIAYR
ncbi:MAG: peptidoglycan-associated lipoprotein [Bordetella sp. SCN 67-23]|uniref:OmpA family protein n=1 Tax=unclassified Pigmentiphaga TaxID=2626614 RepID=UPI00086DD379|nr:OmpA family protein [Pigmentiphaga sp. H8]MBN9476111.1 OmpA family protein [Burkholderiales bacterium]ODS71834.1 MAG: peptidoglycan-associated lipoprotein [Bordetella sp. SCN 67-23]ODU80190.1 MAG: peptidoglycan-associated lipoprotein [Bordetella sp. SCN 68-11]OJW87328.1 MAG: peptidoglycan-associated lipoprotein [Burkholderiales bacterium 67-32]AZG10076.1 peptidoglycan-associated lipoprotein [Pigmentiphaga sp. H8]